ACGRSFLVHRSLGARPPLLGLRLERGSGPALLLQLGLAPGERGANFLQLPGQPGPFLDGGLEPGAHGLDQLPHRGSGLLRLGSSGGPVSGHRQTLPQRRGPRPRPLLTALPACHARAWGAWFRSRRRRRWFTVVGDGRELGEHAGDRPRLAGWNVGVETGGHALLSIARSTRALIISVIRASMSLAPLVDGAWASMGRLS